MAEGIANMKNANIPCEEKSSHGIWRYWTILFSFYVFLTFRSMIQEWGTPLEILMARVLPFTYLTFHHTIFREIIFHLLALITALGVIKIINLNDPEFGWIKPAGIKPIIGSAALGAAFCTLITLAGIYCWIVTGGIFLKKFPNAYQLLLTWPVHFKVLPGRLLTGSDMYSVFSNLNTLVTAPIVEELVFRGVLFGALKRKLGTDWTITITSLLDVLMHYNLPGFWFSSNWRPEDTQALFYLPRFAQLLSFSIFAGWLRSRNATLPSLAAFHSAHNFVASSFLWTFVGHG